MPGEFNITLDSPGSGLLVYAVVFDAAWNGTESLVASGNVWNGSAFVADSFSNRSLGAIILAESPTGSGSYVGDSPSALPTGNYQYLEYSQLGVTPNTATDTQLLLSAGTFSVISASGVNPITLTYDPATSFSGTPQTININRGSGATFQFVPSSPASLQPSDWVFKIGTKKYGVSNTYSVSNGNMVITPTGTIIINPTVADTMSYEGCQTLYGELWRISSDDSTDLHLRIVIVLNSVLV